MNSVEPPNPANSRFSDMTELEILDDASSIADAIGDLEQTLQIKLPGDYREFLIANNGGFPEKRFFRTSDDDELGEEMRVFYGVNVKEEDLLRTAQVMATVHPLFRNDLLAVGDDWFGNSICLILSQSDYGKVAFWDHECKEYDVVFDSFSALLNALTDVDPNEVP